VRRKRMFVRKKCRGDLQPSVVHISITCSAISVAVSGRKGTK
jgi:hypothetical protein